MNIGEKIKFIRKNKKITQKQLGELIGKKEITIRKYESGEITPNIEILNEISNAFGIQLIELIDTTKLKDIPAKGILKNTNKNSSIEQQILAESILEKIGGNSAIFEHILYDFLTVDSVKKELNYKFDEFTPDDFRDLSQFMFYMLKLKIIEINSKHK